ncbi:bacterial sugar transferase [Coprobacillus sp. CAG:826]|nr:bacterial sugar transferase [Coprobacillus sp. CAG:826]
MAVQEKEIVDAKKSITKQEEIVFVPYKLKFFQKVYRAIKAVMDFLIALISLILLSPLFIVVAIAIKIDSKGPVFFTHKRIGKNNKEFTCIKFRSMAVEARPDVAGYEYQEVNAYITKVGKFLRKTSIDELPQLFCMLTGKMSLIGYRPSQHSENELNECRERSSLYQIRPGITGWAQVNGRDVLAAHPKRKAVFDAYYLHHFSLWLDIKIFFLTLFKVFKHSDIEEGVIVDEKEKEKEEERVLQ